MKKLVVLTALLMVSVGLFSQINKRFHGNVDIDSTLTVGDSVNVDDITILDQGTYGKVNYDNIEVYRFASTYATFLQNVTIGAIMATKNLLVYGNITATDGNFGGDVTVADTLYMPSGADTSYFLANTDTFHVYSENPIAINSTSLTNYGNTDLDGTLNVDGVATFNDTLKLNNIYPNLGNTIKIDGYVDIDDTINIAYLDYSTLILLNSGQKFVFTSAAIRPAINGTGDLGATSFYYGNGYINNVLGSGTANRTWGLSATTNLLAGANLTIGSSDCTAGGTADRNGGMLTLSSGKSKGTGIASVRIQRNSRAASTGTTLNTLSDAVVIPSEFNLTDESANNLFEIAIAANEYAGATIQFSIEATDGTDYQVYTGIVLVSAVDKGGALTSTITESSANSALSAGTLTTAWSIVDGANKITIAVTPTSSLVPTSAKIRYTIMNNSDNAITQL